MLSINLALISEIEGHDPSDVARVAAALSRQATRDFAPIWNMEGATVDTFPKLEDVPVGYWPLIVVADIKDAGGVHLDKDGQPFALIEMSDSWSLTASHETLEMLADPWGNRLVPGRSIKPNQGRVEYLVEVCDPSEAAQFAYTVNDVLVSDFYTPRFFDPTDTPAPATALPAQSRSLGRSCVVGTSPGTIRFQTTGGSSFGLAHRSSSARTGRTRCCRAAAVRAGVPARRGDPDGETDAIARAGAEALPRDEPLARRRQRDHRRDRDPGGLRDRRAGHPAGGVRRGLGERGEGSEPAIASRSPGLIVTGVRRSPVTTPWLPRRKVIRRHTFAGRTGRAAAGVE